MTPAQVKPAISPELLNQIDIRVGTIESVSDVANSEKLVALRVNFGDHRRTVLAGMKLRTLAIKTGMSITYIAKIERGGLPPPVEKKLLRLAKVLGRSRDELLNAAGRLPADVILIAQREPARYAKLVRGTSNLSQKDLDRVIHHALSEVQRIFHEKKNSKP